MSKITSLSLTTAFVVALASAAHAQSASPQIPTPANPYPMNPVATDGSPLPVGSNTGRGGLMSGRSVFSPVGDVIDAGAQTAGSIVSVVPNTANAILGR